MANGIAPNSSFQNQTPARPFVTSYDSEYEHSFDRYVDIKLLLQAADKAAHETPAAF